MTEISNFNFSSKILECIEKYINSRAEKKKIPEIHYRKLCRVKTELAPLFNLKLTYNINKMSNQARIKFINNCDLDKDQKAHLLSPIITDYDKKYTRLRDIYYLSKCPECNKSLLKL